VAAACETLYGDEVLLVKGDDVPIDFLTQRASVSLVGIAYKVAGLLIYD
jgi:hypothetical protein